MFTYLNTIKVALFNGALLPTLLSAFLSFSSQAQDFRFELSAGTLDNVLLSIAQQANMQLVMRANVSNINGQRNFAAIKQHSSLDELLNNDTKKHNI